jgi:hypothetical protein
MMLAMDGTSTNSARSNGKILPNTFILPEDRNFWAPDVGTPFFYVREILIAFEFHQMHKGEPCIG